LGGHQWAQLSTTDLVHWQQHPLAVAITEDWEGSICTGSVFYHQGRYHAFYATRKTDRTQHLSHAVSPDGVHFEKARPNPFLSPPAGFSPYHFRDPFVFESEPGRFQMLVTAMLEKPYSSGQGCLLRLSSCDLWSWQVEEPFFIPEEVIVPECPDYFFWNGYYYLLCGLNLTTRYRFSRHPFGPWVKPGVDCPGSRLEAVMKTAAFGPGRRLGVAWVGTRAGNKNDGQLQWGGQLLFRELVHNPDGTLGTRFVPEMLPLYSGSGFPGQGPVRLSAEKGPAEVCWHPLSENYSFRCQVIPQGKAARFGFGLRCQEKMASGCPLVFDLATSSMSLGQERLEKVALTEPFFLHILLTGDLFDVEIAGKRCLINRCPETRGNCLLFFAEREGVSFENIEVKAFSLKEW
ncbi:MAG TPA: hypothetical protein PKW42_04560, partial [bacterium]|nr:hypothetical protein [bacterium]